MHPWLVPVCLLSVRQSIAYICLCRGHLRDSVAMLNPALRVLSVAHIALLYKSAEPTSKLLAHSPKLWLWLVVITTSGRPGDVPRLHPTVEPRYNPVIGVLSSAENNACSSHCMHCWGEAPIHLRNANPQRGKYPSI